MSLARLGEAPPRTASASTPRPSGTRTYPTTDAYGCAKGEVLETVNTGLGCVSCALAPDGRPLFMVATDWSNGPAMVTGELTGRVLALDVSVPCPDFPTTGMPAGLAGARYLPGQPGSRPLYATTRSTSGALSGTGTGGSKMPLRASRSSGGYMPVMAARQASSVAGSCW